MFPAKFSLSVWSSCSDESVSSRVCSSSSEGRRALRYGMVLGCAAITDNTVADIKTNDFNRTTDMQAYMHIDTLDLMNF